MSSEKYLQLIEALKNAVIEDKEKIENLKRKIEELEEKYKEVE